MAFWGAGLVDVSELKIGKGVLAKFQYGMVVFFLHDLMMVGPVFETNKPNPNKSG